MTKKVVRNDEGKVVPEHCSCGGKIGVFIEGEPIYKCTACGKYYGTMPFPKKSLDESLNKKNKNMKKNAIKINESQLRNIVVESVKNVLKEDYIGKNWFDENPNNGAFSENFEKVLNDSYNAASILLDACVKEISNIQDMNAKRELEIIREKTSNYLTNLHSYVPGTRTC